MQVALVLSHVLIEITWQRVTLLIIYKLQFLFNLFLNCNKFNFMQDGNNFIHIDV